MSSRGLYQPQIADEHIRKLYHIAKRYGLKMTKLLNLIVAVAIEELEHAGDVCDEPSVTPTVAQSRKGGIYQARIAAHGQSRRAQAKNHDRQTIRHLAHICERDQRKEV